MPEGYKAMRCIYSQGDDRDRQHGLGRRDRSSPEPGPRARTRRRRRAPPPQLQRSNTPTTAAPKRPLDLRSHALHLGHRHYAGGSFSRGQTAQPGRRGHVGGTSGPNRPRHAPNPAVAGGWGTRGPNRHRHAPNLVPARVGDRRRTLLPAGGSGTRRPHMDDAAIVARINELADEEHRLERSHGRRRAERGRAATAARARGGPRPVLGPAPATAGPAGVRRGPGHRPGARPRHGRGVPAVARR